MNNVFERFNFFVLFCREIAALFNSLVTETQKKSSQAQLECFGLSESVFNLVVLVLFCIIKKRHATIAETK